MSTKTNSLKQSYYVMSSKEKNRQCHCHDNKNNNETYKIVENYRSILDRKQTFISSWKVLQINAKLQFTPGIHFRTSTNALIIRSNDICLINPWYKYITINHHHLLSSLKQKQYSKICEIILLECNSLTNSLKYEFAILQCPCVQQLNTLCTYCRLTLTATEQSSNSSLSIDCINNDTNINQSFHPQSQLYNNHSTTANHVKSEEMLSIFHVDANSSISETKSIELLQDDDDDDDNKQSSSQSNTGNHSMNSSISSLINSQDVIQSNENWLFHNYSDETTRKYLSRGTQTKLFAIFLPQSPLSKITQANIEERTSMNVTRTCQVNTLSYLIQTNQHSTHVQDSIINVLDLQDIDLSSTTSSYLNNEIQIPEGLVSKRKVYRVKKSERVINDKHEMNVPSIELKRDDVDEEEETIHCTTKNEDQFEELISMSSPLTCINVCDVIDINKSHVSLNTLVIENQQNKESYQSKYISNLEDIDTQVKCITKSFNNSHSIDNIKYTKTNNSNKQLTYDQKSHSLVSFNCIPRKLYALKNNPYRLILRKRHRHRNKKFACGFLHRLYHRRKSFTMQFISSKQHDSSSLTLTNDYLQSIPHLHLNNTSNSIYHYKAYDHISVARASKHSRACQQLHMLLNNHNSSVEELLHSQLLCTSNDNYQSVCIVIDDDKQSDQYRSSFLHYIYRTLSNSLKEILDNQTIQMTCMNLVFFNKSICDLVHMQRLRLIDTGTKILLQPSCQISIRTVDDIDGVINRLSTKMSFVHQIFIIHFHCERSNSTSSFLFLHLAPICSVRSRGLLTTLNSTTYSILNLIRQLNHGQLYNHNTAKQYLFNDNLLNRLLKSYLFSSQQTISVVTVKPKEHEL